MKLLLDRTLFLFYINKYPKLKLTRSIMYVRSAAKTNIYLNYDEYSLDKSSILSNLFF